MKSKKPSPVIAPDLAEALRKNKRAKAIFEKYPPSHKRAYIEYIDEAKKAETRANRIRKSIKRIIEVGFSYKEAHE